MSSHESKCIVCREHIPTHPPATAVDIPTCQNLLVGVSLLGRSNKRWQDFLPKWKFCNNSVDFLTNQNLNEPLDSILLHIYIFIEKSEISECSDNIPSLYLYNKKKKIGLVSQFCCDSWINVSGK